MTSVVRCKMKQGSLLLFVVCCLVGLTTGVIRAQTYIDMVSSEFGTSTEPNYSAWNPGTLDWTNSNQKGYNEGQAVPVMMPFTLTEGDLRTVRICFQYHTTNNTNADVYAFIGLADSYDADYNPPLSGGPIIHSLDGVSTDSGTIDSVTYIPVDDPNYCPDAATIDAFGYEIQFTVADDGDGTPGEEVEGYLYLGLVLAKAGMISDEGETIPAGGGAGAWDRGNFQSSIAVSGSRTIQFTPGDIEPDTADLTVTINCPYFGSANPSYSIQVMNLGPGTALGTSLVATLPGSDYLIYNSAALAVTPDPTGDATGGGSCTLESVSATETVITCSIGDGVPLLTNDVSSGANWTVLLYVTHVNMESSLESAGVTAAAVTPAGTIDSTFGDTCLDGTLAVTLSYLYAERANDAVTFNWQTATESGMAGFNILIDGGLGLARLNADLIASRVIDSVTPTNYAFSAVTDAEAYYVEEVSVNGAATRNGPFLVGKEYGAFDEASLQPSIWLPVVIR